MNLAPSVSMRSKRNPAYDGGTIEPGEFVGCVLLDVDDHLMGGSEGHTMKEDLVWKWHWLLQDGLSFFGGRHFTLLPDRSFQS